MKKAAVVLIAHGTVEKLDDLPAFLANIRHGRPAPPEIVAEVRRRYEAIGGRSPLNDITRELAKKLEARLGVPVRVAMRLFDPYPKDVLAELLKEGIERVIVLPLAQHSAHVYAVTHPGLEIVNVPNWGREPLLTKAFAAAIRAAIPAGVKPALVLTAHSLPQSVIDAGDPYEKEFRGSAADVQAAVADVVEEAVVSFQSQGMTPGMKWLGPDLRATLEDLAKRGKKEVLLAPVGFLADHVEILYDLDIEAKAWADELGIVTYRSASLNAGDELVLALDTIARRAMEE